MKGLVCNRRQLSFGPRLAYLQSVAPPPRRDRWHAVVAAAATATTKHWASLYAMSIFCKVCTINSVNGQSRLT